MGQSESLATAADPLVQRQSLSREASDRKSRQMDAGSGRAIWSTPETKSEAVLSLRRRGYKPRPLRRVYIPKSNRKMRPLGFRR